MVNYAFYSRIYLFSTAMSHRFFWGVYIMMTINTQVTAAGRLIFFCAFLLLASCSSNYSFQSNLDADKAKHYFSASQVIIYNNENEFPGNFTYKGLVEGDDCQENAYLAPPDIINARTQARQLAFLKQANAIIFTHCLEVGTKQCIAQTVCYGKAYLIENTTHSNNDKVK